MARLHRLLADGTYPNAKRAARELEVSEKTILRDLEFMRDRRNLPVAYNAAKRGYYYTEKVADLPDVKITEGELFALLVARRALEQYQGTSFEAQLTTAFQKLASGMADTVTLKPADLASAMTFSDIGISHTDMKTFAAVDRACRERRVLRFDYQKAEEPKDVDRDVEPYHVAFLGNLAYMIGLDRKRNALRQFALTRMSRTRVLNQRFDKPVDFSPEAYFRGGFPAHGGDERHTIRIRFDSYGSFFIRERRWHKTQRLTELGGGAVELGLELTDLTEIERWVLSWGRHATVIEPAKLREKVREVAERLVQVHRF